MELLKEFEVTRGAGIGGYNKDDSDDLEDQGYAEKLMLNPETLEFLAKMQVATKEDVKTNGKTKTVVRGGTLTVTREDLEKSGFGTTGMQAAANGINKVIVALEIPYFAKAYSSSDAEAIEREYKSGEKVGQTYSQKLYDRIRIQRIGETFDINEYSVTGSTKLEPKEDGEKAGSPTHEPTEGVRLRTARWISEKGAPVEEYLKIIGVPI